MDNVICLHCNISDYRLEPSGPHQKAVCNNCNQYIKFVSQPGDPKMYIGKYKDFFIKDIPDIEYLAWALANMKLKAKQHEAVLERIVQLKKEVPE